jgi:hypothetical protein
VLFVPLANRAKTWMIAVPFVSAGRRGLGLADPLRVPHFAGQIAGFRPPGQPGHMIGLAMGGVSRHERSLSGGKD